MKVLALNRRAKYDYEIIKRYQAGISLLGSEVKAIREGKASLKEAFCLPKEKGIYIVRLHIGQYSKAGKEHDPYRERLLLLNRKEIEEIKSFLQQKRLVLVPLKLYDKRGWIKLEIALARKKKKAQKKQALKERAVQREMEAELKRYQT